MVAVKKVRWFKLRWAMQGCAPYPPRFTDKRQVLTVYLMLNSRCYKIGVTVRSVAATVRVESATTMKVRRALYACEEGWIGSVSREEGDKEKKTLNPKVNRFCIQEITVVHRRT